ncbi:hypothetical protein KVR01_010565 [Diaporthe batatas]|uniref:uncharacterized protein n=1 Tax=Diaporthe batatas TaxID=748121 RepID=UPI001D042FB6|nr:uncharacterized protein KVR01_010565 [Diaporthe batatas]KAG8159928.1 hypothetical protein KVR01_010565 [Diaporthe batatas]
MGLEFDHEKIPLYKLIVHIIQIVLSVTIWVLEIIVFKGGDINGNNGWTFGVCFLSVPVWIYLIMAPRYPRARRIADPKAMLVFDFIYTVLWLSAFATQAAYNTANDCGTACGPSKAIVGLGVFNTLFWALSTLLSVATHRYYNFNGVLPGYETSRGPRTNSIDPDKAAFSTAPVDEEAYAPVGMNDQDDEPEFNASPYGGGMGTSSTRHDAHDINPYTADTSYGGAAAVHNPPFDHHGEYNTHTSPAPPAGHMYAPPPAGPADYDDDRPVAFPSADYSRVQ